MRLTGFLLTLLVLIVLQAIAEARLGERAEPARLSSELVGLKRYRAYSVQVHDQPGLHLAEFSGADGVVFAVSWRGAIQPDLSLYLGDYFTEYKRAFQKRSGAAIGDPASKHRPITITGESVIVRRSGHMRDWRGFAYVPELIPTGVSIGDLHE